MAQITTIDGNTHIVKESVEDIDDIIRSFACIETGMIKLNLSVTVSSYGDGVQDDTGGHEDATFMRANIIMYC